MWKEVGSFERVRGCKETSTGVILPAERTIHHASNVLPTGDTITGDILEQEVNEQGL